MLAALTIYTLNNQFTMTYMPARFYPVTTVSECHNDPPPRQGQGLRSASEQ